MVEQLFTTIAAQVDGTPCCRLVGPGRRRPLREDGPQRHRVRRHAAHRRGLRPARPGRRHGRGRAGRGVRALEPGRPRLVPDRDHRQGAAQGRPGQRPAAGRRDPRPGRAEGHRPLDRPVGPGAGRAGHRHHRGGVRPGPVVTARAAHGRGQGPARAVGPAGGRPGPKRSSTTSATPCTPPRWSPTPRGSSRSRPPPTPTAGTSSWAGWPPSGGAAASSGPGSWTASARPTRPTRACGTSCSPGTSATPSADAQDAWRRVVATAVNLGVATPAFASSLAYYDGFRRERGPANLLQAQRDFFGAHTYRRTDRPGSFHTRWSRTARRSRPDLAPFPGDLAGAGLLGRRLRPGRIGERAGPEPASGEAAQRPANRLATRRARTRPPAARPPGGGR